MKKALLRTAVTTALLALASTAHAGFFNDNNDPWDDNDWPEWTPMYWMEEFMDEWDDDDDDYYRYGPRWGGPGWGGPRWGGGPGFGWAPSFNGPSFGPSFGSGPRWGRPVPPPGYLPPRGPAYGPSPRPYGPPPAAPYGARPGMPMPMYGPGRMMPAPAQQPQQQKAPAQAPQAK